MLNVIDIYSFIPVSDCVGMGHIARHSPGFFDAVKTALFIL